MRCPPEAVSMTFDRATGKVVKLCTGFAVDRLVGNTNGCTGVLAAAVIAGQPPSDWELYPPVAVIQRVFGRPVAQLKEAESFLAPFPETVMIQLVKGVLATDMGAKDPTLLADDFTYCTLYQGPIRKKAYLEKFAEQEFEGLDPSFSHFRIDPYDPVRVWVDVVLAAPGFEGVPQAMSFTFNEDGFCSRITSGAVMDPTIGNGGGLAGSEGYRYATGKASPGIVTRPLPRSVGRFRKRTLGLANGVGVDEYMLRSQRQSKKTASPPARPAPATSVKPHQFTPKPPAESEPTQRTPSVVVKKPESAASERQAKVEEQDRKQQAKAREGEAKQRAADQAEERRRQEESRLADQKRQQEQRKQDSDAAATEAKRKKLEAKRVAQVEGKEAALEQKEKQALQAKEDTRQKQGESAKAKQQQKVLEAKEALQAKEDARREQEAALKAAQKQKELEAKQALQAKEAARREQEVELKAVQKQKELVAKKALQSKEDARRDKEEAVKAAKKEKELQAKRALEAKEDARRQQESTKKAAVEQKVMEAQAQARRAEAAKQRKQQEQKKLAIEREEKKMIEDDKKRKEAELLKLNQAKARQAQIEARQVEAEKKKREAAEVRAAQIAARQKVDDERKAASEGKRNQQRKEKAALDSLTNAAPRATIALFGFGSGSEEADEMKAPSPRRTKAIGKAPGGVPTISSWRKKFDGSITGLITGSKNFSEGERVTTSPIVKGKVEVGEVVTTGSGSRYFLS